ncbi:MAG: hypothetical protein M1817_000413 [Caeruleum heppii]|nr:MAG: hypothetical protein M1817_000413 [Caeruleum heppii]
MFISKTWKTPRVLLGLFIVEFCSTVAALALFGIAAPDLYRTRLWKDGALNGFNSNPNVIVYAYANYRPVPKVPMVWSSFLTNWNLVISVLSTFILLVKVVMSVMHLWHPLLSLFVHIGLTAIWAVSVYGQAGSDHIDPRTPSDRPWYLTKSCDVVFNSSNKHYCNMAKGSFAVTVIALVVFAVHIPLSIYSLIPSKLARQARRASSPDLAMKAVSPDDSLYSPNRPWSSGAAQQVFDPPPKTPITPRTMAFNKLSNVVPGRKK